MSMLAELIDSPRTSCLWPTRTPSPRQLSAATPPANTPASQCDIGKLKKNIPIFKYLLQNLIGRYQLFLIFYFYFEFCFCNYIKIVQLYLLNKEYLRIKLTLSEFGANILKQKAHKNSSVHIEEIQALLVFKRIQLHKPKVKFTWMLLQKIINAKNYNLRIRKFVLRIWYNITRLKSI